MKIAKGQQSLILQTLIDRNHLVVVGREVFVIINSSCLETLASIPDPKQ